MKRILVLLSFFGLNFLFSQGVEIPKTKYGIDFEWTVKRDLNSINFFNISELIDLFISDFEHYKKCYLTSREIPKEFKNKLDFFVNNLKYNSTKIFDFDLTEDETLGISKSIYDDNKITLSINPKLWSDSSTPKKLYVLYHELGHDILNFEHGQGGKMMFTLSQSDYTFDQFSEDRGYMFYNFFDNFFEKLGYKELVITTKSCLTDDWNYHEKFKGWFYLNKLFTGEKKEYYKNGNLSFKKTYNSNGKREGKWVWYYENGNIKRIENHLNGDFHGESLSYFEDGNIKWIRNLLHNEDQGESIEYYENGNIKKIDNYKNNELEGKSVWYYENGERKMIENYSNGLRNGELIMYYESGNIESKFNYVDGKLQGNGEFYFENGKIEGYIYFLNNKYEGDYRRYYENGEIEKTGTYKNDLKNGIFKFYNKNGEVEKIELYENGEIIEN
jgi:antitoxin component YwqK of YwqJK toxin-antitoxin module